MEAMPIENLPIAAYSSGSSSVSDINQAIQKAWDEIYSDPDLRSEVARQLEIQPENFPARSPFAAKPLDAGTVDSTLAIYALVGGFVGSLAKDIAVELAKDIIKDAAKESLKLLMRAIWEKAVKERTEAKLPAEGLGAERPLPDDIQ